MNEIDGTSRPGAAGHRFGPGLHCTECGVSWDEHQEAPRRCEGASAKVRAPVEGVDSERGAAADSCAEPTKDALSSPTRISYPHT